MEIVRNQTLPSRSRHAPPPQDPPRSTPQIVSRKDAKSETSRKVVLCVFASNSASSRENPPFHVFRHALHLFAPGQYLPREIRPFLTRHDSCQPRINDIGGDLHTND